MYLDYFGLKRLPFSIAPDPDSLYLSADHQEALAHLNYSLTSHGGLVCLTGEVGTGKTTICRAFIDSLPESVDVAYIFNPMLSANELLHSICIELGFDVKVDASNKLLMEVLYAGLLERYSEGRKVICIVDEAQSMPLPLLEQIRLLTNLETSKEKLLTLILVGQPELQEVLARYEVRQLNQRITARFHLDEISKADIEPYVAHRLACAGMSDDKVVFSKAALRVLWECSQGVPRLINSIADRAMLGAYSQSVSQVSVSIVRNAMNEVLPNLASRANKKRRNTHSSSGSRGLYAGAVIAFLFLAVSALWQSEGLMKVLGFQKPLQVLAAQYGLENIASCEVLAQQTTFECLRFNWPDAELTELARPVLFYPSGSSDGEVVTALDIPEKYRGKVLLFRQDHGMSDKGIKVGQTHSIIPWVRSVLASNEQGNQWNIIIPDNDDRGAKNALASSFESFYDPFLADKVKVFQESYGLRADRIIGKKTLLVLEDVFNKESK